MADSEVAKPETTTPQAVTAETPAGAGDTGETAKPTDTPPATDAVNGAGDGNEPASDTEKKIIKQVEYYFGDVNLGKDKFMKEEVKKDDGWISMDVMLNFKRLASICSDKDAICRALRKSTSGLMQVDEDNTKIRRCPDNVLDEFTDETKLERRTRTIYAKGFPLDSTIDTLEPFFEKYGKIDTIQMKRDKNKVFKGSVFVLFKTVEEAQNFVTAESVMCGETALVRMMQMDFFRKKGLQKKEQQEERLQAKQKKLADGEKTKDEDETNEIIRRMTKGALVYITGLDGKTLRNNIKEGFSNFGKVAWVDMLKNDTEAKIRFDGEGSAQAALEKAKEAGEGKVKLNDLELESRILEGEEEIQHWRELFQSQREGRDHKKSGRGKRKGGKYGGGGPQRKKRRNRDDDDKKEAAGDDNEDGDDNEAAGDDNEAGDNEADNDDN